MTIGIKLNYKHLEHDLKSRKVTDPSLTPIKASMISLSSIPVRPHLIEAFSDV